MQGTLTFDIETHSRRHLYTMPPERFVRLIGYAWGDGPVRLTTSLEEIRDQILKARWIIGHNIHDFDLRAIFGIDSDIPMQLADEGRVYDTWTHAALVHPAPPVYTDRHGRTRRADTPEKMLSWFSLDEQAYQLGVKGKTHDLKELAYEYGDPSLKKADRIEDGFGRIPVDDPRYREYLIGDVEASRAVAKALLRKGPLDAYAMREQRIESRKACISSNGWRVDLERAQARVEYLAQRREAIMAELVEKYDFPTEGKQPWRTDAGKAAILAALADAGVTEKTHPDWPRTASGALSLGGDVLINLTKGTPAEDLGQALAELMGQRSLSELAIKSTYPDGKVHPEITMLQRSGRWSTTNPGLTIWTARGEGAVEKSYFIPDSDDHVILEIDLSNADARAVAALSGDEKYAERFQPGADGHLLNAWAAWGKDVVGTNKKDPVTARYRQMAKPLGHGWSYGGRAKTLAKTAGVSLEDATKFVEGMDSTYKKVVAWQNRVRRFARRHGYVVNPWGRKMWTEPGREFTQAPALLGQSVTREVVCDAILRMSHPAVRSIKAQIHDALIFSIPREGWERYKDYLFRQIETELDPPGGQLIKFPAESGPPGSNWHEACH